MATYYAGLEGNDNAVGTSPASAWRYLSTGASRLNPGDTLRLLKGVWSHEKDVIDSQRHRVPSGTSWEKPITLEANPGDQVRLTPPAGLSAVKLSFGEWGTPHYWVVRNLAVDGSLQHDPVVRRRALLHSLAAGHVVQPSPHYLWDAPELLYTSYGAHHVRFEKLLVEHTMGCAVQFTINGIPAGGSYSSFNEMHECVFRDIGNATGDSGHGGPGINNGYATYTQTDDNLWRRCAFSDTRGMGTVCYGSRNRWEGNRWTACGTRGGPANAMTFGSGSHCDANGVPIMSRDNVFVNNIVEHCPYGGLLIYTNSVGTQALHNTFHGNGLWAVMAQYYGSARVANNVFSENQANINDIGGGALVADHNVSENLKLTDPAKFDYTLQAGSSAINAGADVSQWLTTDYTGAPRTAPFDCGAFEHVPGVIITPPPPDVVTYRITGEVQVAKDGSVVFMGQGQPAATRRH